MSDMIPTIPASRDRWSILKFPERLPASLAWLPYALLISVTSALYAVTLYYEFVWDDWVYIVQNYRIQGLDWMHIRAFWSDIYLGHYAPVHHSFFALVYHFAGMEPYGYHLGQVLIHAAVVCLVYLVVKKLETPGVALVASLLFAVHPANIETVAWISESKSTLAFLFFLISFYFFIRLRERQSWTDGVLAGLFLILSVLAKINTVVAPAIFLLYDYRQGATIRTLKWRSLALFFAISGMFTVIHLGAFHGSTQSMEQQFYGGPGLHIMQMPLLLAFYLQQIVFPVSLSAWQMFPVQETFNWLVTLGWLGMAAMSWVLSRGNRKIQFWVLWIFLFLLPVLQIVPFPIWVADRYLYIPAIGAFVLAGIAFFYIQERLPKIPSRALEAVIPAIVLLLGWRTHQHIPIWKSDLTLWAATTPTCLTSAYCHMNLGTSLLKNGMADRGMPELIRAVEIRANRHTLEQLGDGFTFAAQDYKQAIIAYKMAAELPNATPEIHGKLARAYYLAGDLEAARKAIERGARVSEYDPGLWIINGFVLWKQGNLDEARRSLNAALGMTGRKSNPAAFFVAFMGNSAEVGALLADLRNGVSEPRQ